MYYVLLVVALLSVPRVVSADQSWILWELYENEGTPGVAEFKDVDLTRDGCAVRLAAHRNDALTLLTDFRVLSLGPAADIVSQIVPWTATNGFRLNTHRYRWVCLPADVSPSVLNTQTTTLPPIGAEVSQPSALPEPRKETPAETEARWARNAAATRAQEPDALTQRMNRAKEEAAAHRAQDVNEAAARAQQQMAEAMTRIADEAARARRQQAWQSLANAFRPKPWDRPLQPWLQLQPPPVRRLPVNCTSNVLGTYTYTNCW